MRWVNGYTNTRYGLDNAQFLALSKSFVVECRYRRGQAAQAAQAELLGPHHNVLYVEQWSGIGTTKPSSTQRGHHQAALGSSVFEVQRAPCAWPSSHAARAAAATHPSAIDESVLRWDSCGVLSLQHLLMRPKVERGPMRPDSAVAGSLTLLQHCLMKSSSNSTRSILIPLDSATLVSRMALAAAAMVVLMLGIFIVLGIGQDPLQYMHSSSDYAAILLKNPPALRVAIGLDNLFIVLYSTMFLALGSAVWERTLSRPLLVASLSLTGLFAALDLLENMHFLSLISAALLGQDVSPTHIELQVWESLVKFHVSYLALFLLGLALPCASRLEMALCFALRWVQLPVGLLIYLVPAEFAKPLVFGRFTFFLVALLLLWAIFRRPQSGSNVPA